MSIQAPRPRHAVTRKLLCTNPSKNEMPRPIQDLPPHLLKQLPQTSLTPDIIPCRIQRPTPVNRSRQLILTDHRLRLQHPQPSQSLRSTLAQRHRQRLGQIRICPVIHDMTCNHELEGRYGLQSLPFTLERTCHHHHHHQQPANAPRSAYMIQPV